MNAQRFHSGGFVPPQHVSFGCYSIRSMDLYVAAVICRDPRADNWRWKKAGYIAKVEARKIAQRGVR